MTRPPQVVDPRARQVIAWAFGHAGTRWTVCSTPHTGGEKPADAEQVHGLTGPEA